MTIKVRVLITLLVLLNVVLLVQLFLGTRSPRTSFIVVPQIVQPEDLVCFSNPSGFLLQEGWHRMYEAERYKVAQLAGDGKVDVRLERSLICHDFRPEQHMKRTIVTEWWWRRK